MTPVPSNTNELAHQRNALCLLLWDLLLLANRDRRAEEADATLREARSLAERLYKWHDDLPKDIEYQSRAPIGVYELQWVLSLP